MTILYLLTKKIVSILYYYLLRSISKIVVNNIVRLSNISFSPFYSSSRHKSRLWYISFLVWYIKNYLCTKLPPWRSLYLVPFSFYLWQLTVWIMLLKRQKHSNNQYQMSILSDFKGVFSWCIFWHYWEIGCKALMCINFIGMFIIYNY